ncbi:MAG TPA: DNA-binding protein YbiB [Casimicrobiaceae bacterium]|nr:DNA-binding protein YbiB [Casimicrobiaceae bacterium]
MTQADAQGRRKASPQPIEKTGRRLPQALGSEGACKLLGSMLDDGAPAREIATLLRAHRLEADKTAELAGFVHAINARIARIDASPDRPRPVVLPTYGGVGRQANLTALLALLLRRYGVPVLLHGTLDADRHFGRVATAAILRELGIDPASSVPQAREMLAKEELAFVPIAVLAPAFGVLFNVNQSTGSTTTMLARLIDPFRGAGFRIVSVPRPEDLSLMHAFLRDTLADALLLRGTEGEPFADPRRQPQLEWFDRGIGNVLFDAESRRKSSQAGPAGAADAAATAAWTAAALAGTAPIPQSILNQLACCLHATRRAPTG